MQTLILAVTFILMVLVAPEGPYDRSSYGGWIDADGDCLNTRHEVLAAESLIPPTIIDCKVTVGLWYGLFTGKTFTDPKKLDVDHMVPLKEAEISGASLWSRERKRLYANDLSNPGHLLAVSAGANRSKGSRDVAKWLPSNLSFRCAYVKMWVEIKKRWGLSMDRAESNAVESVLTLCD